MAKEILYGEEARRALERGKTGRLVTFSAEGQTAAAEIKANYDNDMLYNSGRPMALIERIESNWGHLSNEQAGEFVRQIAHSGLQHIVLAHISQDCNTPEKAHRAMQQTLRELKLDTQLVCAPAAYRLPWIEITAD